MTPTTQQQQVLTESQVRSLRDKVFNHPSSDSGWEACKDNWMKPECVKWLMEMSARMDTTNSTIVTRSLEGMT